MASNYLSTPETTNFARLSRLVVDIICDLLRAVLKAKVPPPGLTAILQSQQFQLSRNLEPRLQRILYPVCGVFVGTLEDLDFTLLYKLVRNIQGINIPEHNNGWGKPPDLVDRSLSANIDRLRVQRNEAYGHLPTASLSNSDFNSRWNLIRQSVLEIEKDALTGDTYVTAVDELRTMNMDPEAENYYIEELEKQHKADLEVKAILQDVKDRQAIMATNISDITTRQEVMATDVGEVSSRQAAMATNISDITTRQEVMTTDVGEVSSRQAAMATNISDIATRQEVMTTDVSEVSSRQAVMATNISDIATRQGTITRDIHHLKDDVAAVKETVNVLSANKDIHPDLKPMIERAKARIKKEKEEKKFYPTKGFCDAKEKLLKNKVVVIKGNTGDGKTAIAVQLLHWLSEEQQAGQPLQLHKIKKLDLLSPNLKLITFIDDIFGENELSKTDVGEWNKRVSDVKTCFLDEQTKTNFLVITVRNEVFNSLEKRSMGTVFTEDNLIDLSSHTYKIAKEKEELLEMYKPENFLWTDEEKTQITTYAPNIGFPQCCQLFYNSEVLQKERARFFENPFDFLNEALSRLQECSALLYLFLNDGMIKVKDLDPNSKKVNKKLLKEAFNINLTKGENDRSTLTCEKEIGFVKESLEKLVGFLVVKDEDWSGEDLVYRFNHNSVYVAVALLYGQATLIGFIQNCPSKSLSYLTTSTTATNMIVISSDYYTVMCERLLREFECMGYYDVTYIGSLDVWNDPVFVKTFVRLLNDRKVDKLVVLNKACRSGAEECVLYLLSEGVKPNEDTALSLVRSRHWNDSNKQVCLLRKMVVYLNDESKLDVLNEACCSGAVECVLYLLSEGVKPNEDTVFDVVMRRSVKVLDKLLTYDITPTARGYNNNNVLHEACKWGREEMVTLLCDTYPHLVHDTNYYGQTPLYAAAREGNCSKFQTIERCVLNSLYRVEDQQHQCESVDGRVIHRNCVCAQYMAQLLDGGGRTVLHRSCVSPFGSGVCLYLCQSYPTLTTAVSKDGKHCLHFIAGSRWSNVDMFTKCEAYVKQYQESTGGHYDITTILDNKWESVLDKLKKMTKERMKEMRTKNDPLLDYLIKEFGKQK